MKTLEEKGQTTTNGAKDAAVALPKKKKLTFDLTRQRASGSTIITNFHRDFAGSVFADHEFMISAKIPAPEDIARYREEATVIDGDKQKVDSDTFNRCLFAGCIQSWDLSGRYEDDHGNAIVGEIPCDEINRRLLCETKPFFTNLILGALIAEMGEVDQIDDLLVRD